MKQKFKQDKGTAGLTILLSIVVMLFIIGLLITIFSLMGSDLQKSAWTETTQTLTNSTTEQIVNGSSAYCIYPGGITAGIRSGRDCALSITFAGNSTQVNSTINSGNYTVTGCCLQRLASHPDGYYNNSFWNITGSYTYKRNSTASGVVFDTTQSLAGTVDWFNIFIVIGAMVVLILLTVVIITAIRGSGMVAGSTQGANNVGTA